MFDVTHLLASVYTSTSPALNAATSMCKVNGQAVDCGTIFAGLGMVIVPFIITTLVLIALMIISSWIIFRKAGKPGWAAIIPFYNMFILLEVVGLPGWWLLVMIVIAFIPVINLLNFAISVYISYRLALSFGKGVGFTIGLIFLPFIFQPILAFGRAQYMGAPKGNIFEGSKAV